MRTGDPVYRTVARRWSRIVLALFAVGVITGTILSFEMAGLWPNFTATFGSVFGLGFAIEGFSFFLEAIFVGIYAYGWDRLSPRLHFLSGIPIVITGFTGSLNVIAVNAWMNHPGGFGLVGGKVVHVRPWSALFGNSMLWSELVHMYIAGYMVTGFCMAGVYAVSRLRGRWTRYERVAMTIPLTIGCLAAPVQVLVGDWIARVIAIQQPIKLAAIEGLARTTRGASEHVLGWYTNGQIKFGIGIPHLLSLLAFHSWNAKVIGLDSVPAGRPAADQRHPTVVPDDGRDRNAAGGAGGRLSVRPHPQPVAADVAVVLLGARRLGAGGDGGSHRRLGDRRGRPPAVGGLPRDDHGAGGDRRRRDPGRLRRAGDHLHRGGRRAGVDPAPPGRRPAGGARRRRPAALELQTGLMFLKTLPLVFVLAGLVLYTVLAGADFGAGMWRLLAGGGERGERIRDHAHHSMGPVWEANHVWLIFVITVAWTAYPTFVGSVASTLAVPFFIAALGIILRGASYALRSAASTSRESRMVDSAFAVGSLVTPFALGTMAGAIAAERVPVGNAAGGLFSSWTGAVPILIGVLAVAFSAYLAAVYLAADAARHGDAELVEAYRVRALGAGRRRARWPSWA